MERYVGWLLHIVRIGINNLEQAYDSFPYDKDLKLLGDPDLARARCLKKLELIETYLEEESMKDKNEAIKARAWTIWMTARCTLMRAKVEEKHLFHTSLSLASCAGSAKHAEREWIKKHPELKDTMKDVWKLSEEMRKSLIASLNASNSETSLHSLDVAHGSRPP